MRKFLITISLLFLLIFMVLPLVIVFVEALRQGIYEYGQAL